MTIVENYFDYTRGWENTNAGWYEVQLPLTTRNKSKEAKEIIQWMYDNLDGTEKHARWIAFEDCAKFKFRYERDAIMFTLRWS